MRPEDLLARLEAGYAYDPMYGQLCNERDQLKAENVKLRELCVKLRAVDDLRWIPAFEAEEHNRRMSDIERCMQELGIEVRNDAD